MISVVIPAYNEESGIGDTVSGCLRALAGIDGAQVVVVDDGSSDGTADAAARAGATVARHPHNLGYGRSLKDGIRMARNDIIGISDADGSYPVERFPEFLELHRKGFDMVVGARTGKHYDESFGKRVLRLILKMLVEFTAGRSIPDINSGLRVFSRKDILPYFKYLCETFSFTTSLTLAYMMNGMFVTYVPIEYRQRVGSTKVSLLRDSLRTMQFIVEAILYFNPIKIFLVFCLGMFAAGAACFVLAAAFGYYSAFLLGIGCILLGFLMFGIGLVSVQLKQLLHLQDSERTTHHTRPEL